MKNYHPVQSVCGLSKKHRLWTYDDKILNYIYLHPKSISQSQIENPVYDNLRFLQSWVRLQGPVIQANGRLTFEDDLRSRGLLCFISMNVSIHTELPDSMGEPRFKKA